MGIALLNEVGVFFTDYKIISFSNQSHKARLLSRWQPIQELRKSQARRRQLQRWGLRAHHQHTATALPERRLKSLWETVRGVYLNAPGSFLSQMFGHICARVTVAVDMALICLFAQYLLDLYCFMLHVLVQFVSWLGFTYNYYTLLLYKLFSLWAVIT